MGALGSGVTSMTLEPLDLSLSSSNDLRKSLNCAVISIVPDISTCASGFPYPLSSIEFAACTRVAGGHSSAVAIPYSTCNILRPRFFASTRGSDNFLGLPTISRITPRIIGQQCLPFRQGLASARRLPWPLTTQQRGRGLIIQLARYYRPRPSRKRNAFELSRRFTACVQFVANRQNCHVLNLPL